MKKCVIQWLLRVRFFAILSLGLVVIQHAEAGTNQVLFLSTANDYVQIESSASLTVQRKFSIEFWVKPTFISPVGAQTFISQRRSDGGTSYSVGVTDGKVRFSMNDGLGNNFTGISESSLTEGVWYHIAAVYDGVTADLYLDGKKVKESALAIMLQPTPFPVLIGREGVPGETRQALGYYDEVRIWNKALTVEEIQFGMFLSLTDAPNLQGCWNFDDGTPKDASINHNDGTLVGKAIIEPDVRLFLNVARAVEVYFDPGLDFGKFQLQERTVSTDWVNVGTPMSGIGKEIQLFQTTRRGAHRFYRAVRVE